VINLYGFLTKEEREMYLLIKNEVPATGAKKALDYTDKISKSFADFKTAVTSKDSSMITNVFGFTKKTADKLISSLKDKIADINITGQEKWREGKSKTESAVIVEAISALIALGYDAFQSRMAVNKAFDNTNNATLEDLIKKSLQNLN
jgi:Holliday junction DNA helicase RuvA